MLFNEEQYDEIMLVYYNHQRENHAEEDRRKEEIYNKIPRIAEIDRNIASSSINACRARLKHSVHNTEEVIENNHRLINEKEALLRSNGYPDNYLKPIYTCPLCQDTGKVGSEYCSCFKQATISMLYKQSTLTNILNKENFKYREGLQFVHTESEFTQESKPLLKFILKYAEMIKFANSNSNSNYKYFGKALNENTILIGNSGIDEIFEILKGKDVEFYKDAKDEKVKFVEENPKIIFYLKQIQGEKYVLESNVDIYKIVLISGKDFKYILNNNKLYKCDKNFENTVIKLIELYRQNYLTELTLEKQELRDFFSIVMPKMKNAIKIKNIDESELEEYKPKELEVKTFFDFDNSGNVIADVVFKYGKEEFNPLDETKKITIPRNIIDETKALNMFRKTGFMFDAKNLRFILPNEDKIYEFMSEDIQNYINRFEVLVTDTFKTKQIKNLKIGGLGIKIQNDLLSIDLENLNIDIEELKGIMEKYELRKKYLI